MRRFLMVLVLVQSLWTVTAQASDDLSQIELRVRCVEPGPCRYAGRMVEVELELFNAGKKAVSLPVEYIRQRGPSVRVHDNHTQRTTSLRTTLAAAALREQLQVLAPGQSIRFSIPVKPRDISRFALRPVDVSLEFSINLTPGLSGEDADMVSSRLRVVGAVGSS